MAKNGPLAHERRRNGQKGDTRANKGPLAKEEETGQEIEALFFLGKKMYTDRKLGPLTEKRSTHSPKIESHHPGRNETHRPKRFTISAD